MEWHSCIADLLNDRCAMPVWLFTWLVFYTTKLGKLIVNVMTVGFYLTILFFWRLLQVRLGPPLSSKENVWDCWGRIFLQLGNPCCPSNREGSTVLLVTAEEIANANKMWRCSCYCCLPYASVESSWKFGVVKSNEGHNVFSHSLTYFTDCENLDVSWYIVQNALVLHLLHFWWTLWLYPLHISRTHHTV